jgi:hypothetical protein
MKFTMIVKWIGSNETWEETEDRPALTTEKACQDWAVQCIQNFNATLRPHEKPRELVGLVRVEVDSQKEVNTVHQWVKLNAVTQVKGNQTFDVMCCEVCNITARRYGLDRIVRDTKYRSQVYAYCNTTLAHLAKKLAK